MGRSYSALPVSTSCTSGSGLFCAPRTASRGSDEPLRLCARRQGAERWAWERDERRGAPRRHLWWPPRRRRDMSAPPAVTATALREHDRAIRRMTAIADAVLPMRFGSMVDEELDLARRVEPAEATLEAALVRVAGREQMTVRVYERQARGEEVTRIAAPPAAAADLGPGARYLLERRGPSKMTDIAPRSMRSSLPPPRSSVRSASNLTVTAPDCAASIICIDRGQGAAYAASCMRDGRPHRCRRDGEWALATLRVRVRGAHVSQRKAGTLRRARGRGAASRARTSGR